MVETILKLLAKGGGVKERPDPKASILCAGCDAGCISFGIESTTSTVSLETSGVDTRDAPELKSGFISGDPKTKGAAVGKGDVKGFDVVIVPRAHVFGGV